jgi:hypothetical protein
MTTEELGQALAHASLSNGDPRSDAPGLPGREATSLEPVGETTISEQRRHDHDPIAGGV